MSLQPLPEVTADTAPFWQSGADGVLRIHRCAACRTWFHPPAPVCPACLSTDVAAEPTSGRATVLGCSVNHQPWAPGMDVPYAVGVVAVDDAPGVHLTTRFVGADPAAVEVGMQVEVTFAAADDVWLPLFRPVRTDGVDGGASS
jgi:uncharacterized OB-fold protein